LGVNFSPQTNHLDYGTLGVYMC